MIILENAITSRIKSIIEAQGVKQKAIAQRLNITAKAFSDMLAEKCKKQVGNPHNAYFINLCSEIDETAKTLTCALPHNATVQSHKTLSKVIDTLDNLVRLIKKESSKMMSTPIDCSYERCFRLIVQASTRINHLLTAVSNSRNRYDGEDL